MPDLGGRADPREDLLTLRASQGAFALKKGQHAFIRNQHRFTFRVGSLHRRLEAKSPAMVSSVGIPIQVSRTSRPKKVSGAEKLTASNPLIRRRFTSRRP